uniref:LOW QUALITY PROTEIN: protein SMAX1-LIKE 3-like n=1 Tax=Elaeis guineensis var. tenera TaxID=51953 RepID=A0A6I9RS59_ELAGV|nr:LOW QUALITY PROTEIN: protein SMAX1-LIKE 3-like [Elaeis guineensis]
MRAGGCTVQQALTPEAASVVKQAINLARRRGHAQVTPLHVANTMLSSSTGLLRAACLQSHSHPLQCKALELCFNVALNRLPASTASPPILGPPHHHHHPHHHHPSLSNALVAAFKRAQAHQRRGSIESQQQPLLAVKIELEQLIISILDDPSVSRVMREAGFSSTQVKSNVEQAISLDICASAPSDSSPSKPKEAVTSPFATPPQVTKTRPSDQVMRSEDVTSVLETLVSRKKRSLVIVGECLATTEGVVRGVMDRVDKGEVHEVLRNLQFITLPLFPFRHMSREEVDQKVRELRCLVKSCVGRGAVLYFGDLKWAADYRAGCGEKGRSYYCPVEHVIMEIASLVCGGIGGESSTSPRFWLMGIATYQTYMKCRIGHPSLEALWCLQPLTIPAGSLGLSLSCDSDSQNHLKSKRNRDGSCWSLLEDGLGSQLTCCADCSIKFETEARSLPNTSNSSHGSIISSLPSWLQQYKTENGRTASNDQGRLQLTDLCKKWNSICSTSHRNHHYPSEMTLNFSSASPSSSSISSYDLRYPTLHQGHQSWSLSLEARHPWGENQIWISETIDEGFESNSRIYSQEHVGQRTSPLSFSNPKYKPNSTSSSGTMEMDTLPKFKELTAENLKTLCNALEKQVPWQKEIIPDIASTILQCRSRMMRRKEKSRSAWPKEETWLFFQGGDTEGKEKIARELASIVFGSPSSFVSIGLSTFASTRSDSTDDLRNKRSRAEVSHSYLERFFEAIRENPHRVILMEDIEQVDYYSQVGIKTAIEKGRIQSYNGEEVGVVDAIIILSCESFDSRSRVCSPPVKQKAESEEEKEESCEEIGACLCLDLNLCAGDEDVEDCSFDGVGFLQLVDGTFFFKLPEDL